LPHNHKDCSSLGICISISQLSPRSDKKERGIKQFKAVYFFVKWKNVEGDAQLDKIDMTEQFQVSS